MKPTKILSIKKRRDEFEDDVFYFVLNLEGKKKIEFNDEGYLLLYKNDWGTGWYLDEKNIEEILDDNEIEYIKINNKMLIPLEYKSSLYFLKFNKVNRKISFMKYI